MGAPPPVPPPPPPAPPQPPRVPAPAPPPPPRRFRIDRTFERGDVLRTVIAVLIGLTSVTAALATWRAVNLADEASDADRQAVVETATAEQRRVDVEAQVGQELRDHARYVANVAAAIQLQRAADATTDTVRSQELLDQAEVFDALASNLLANLVPSNYLTGTADATYLDDQRRQDLQRENDRRGQFDPVQTVARADRLHDRSLRYVRFIMLFVVVALVLTLAQLSKNRLVAPILTVGGAGGYALVSVVAFFGDRG